ncbi:non-ribosomal peptide synthetase [Rhodococcus rhodnii]|uniref:Non-ribosomal peptide synthetase n=2 Tax=Rhodococcus rhodnii TaxID=38312 RepID=R7WKY8_9NOCA|nr:non-ribosomal peptide synthetase [Rhodococcus rhodnii]EOM75962.1 non-ribosomal peptide synthetase [Rhodococcus rhodnii LMG 5362]TXG90127.1 non-ribosomal peptide synthetase [Rhodococcus rhodnii]
MTVEFALSATQRGLWHLQQANPGETFDIGQYVEVLGDLDVDLLRRASDRGSRELESPTVELVDTGGEPWLRIVPDIDDAMGYLDLRDRPDPEATAQTWMRTDITRVRDPFAERPIAATLLRLGDAHWYWYSRVHHLLMDGSGAMALTRRVAEIYTHLQAGTEPPPAGALTLAALADEDARYRASTRYDADERYWSERIPELPDPPRVARASAPPSTLPALARTTLDRALTARIAGHAATAGSDVPVVVGAFAAYVGRLTGTDDVALSIPVSGRTTAAARRSAGAVSNVLPLVVAVHPGVTPRELVTRTRTALTGILRHQRYPFAEIVRRGDGRLRDFGPAVNVMAFQSEIVLGETTASFRLLSTGLVDDLALDIYPAIDGGLRVDLEGNPALYSPADLTCHLDRFVRYLDAFTAEWDAPERTLSLLADDERAALVPARGAAPPEPAPVHALVAGAPDDDAVRCGTVTLTYRVLAERVTALAAALREHGVGPEVPVAVVLPRSAESVVARLAVSAAGGVYVPVDPAYPEQRVRDMLTGTEARVVVTHDPGAVPPGAVRVAPDATGTAFVPPPWHPDAAAYIVHTSGSTGRPKVVVVPHRGVAALAHARREVFPVGPGDRVLHVASPAFDMALEETLVALAHGATLVVAPEGATAGDELTDLLDRERVTHAIITPTVAASLGRTPHLRYLDLGGEAVPQEAVDRWARSVVLLDGYGPSEATVTTLLSAPLDRSPELGRPVPGTTARVLDRQLRAVPPGGIGELYLSGDSLARGYRDAALTASRFVATSDGERMYRTGDLVAVGADGTLTFAGRSDDQLTVHGHRIEPGEIDAVLREVSGVASSVTLIRDDVLASYVVGDRGTRLDAADLRAHCLARLPRHMVPVVTVLDALPLTAHGKTDRAALPAPRSGADRAAHTETERLVAQTVADVLGLDIATLGADSDFFAAGGNSLTGTQLVARLAALTGRRVSLRDVFESPTVESLAARIDAREGERQPLTARGDGPAPLSPAQRRMWVLGQLDSPRYAMPFTVELPAAVSVDVVRAVALDLVTRHRALRTVVAFVDGEPVQVVREPAIEIDTIAADEKTAYILQGLDLEAQAPLRIAVVGSPGDALELLVVTHHIAFDGLSLAPLARDAATAFAARAAGEQPQWDALPVHYTDFAWWQTESLGDPRDPGSLAAREIRYWRRTLDGLPATVALPLDRPRPTGASPVAQSVAWRIPAADRAALDALAAESGVTLFVLLHATLAVLMHKLSGDTDFAIGTPTSGRSDPALDDVVGTFVGTVALRSTIDPHRPFADLLAAGRAAVLGAFAHAELPFDAVVDALAPPRVSGAHPVFQVIFAYDEYASPVLARLAEHGIAAREETLPIARFDLEVHAVDSHDEPGALDFRFAFAARALDRDTVDVWAQRWRRILAAVVADPRTPVARIDTLTPAEHAARDGAPWHEPEATTLGEAFERRAALDPDAVAVVAGDETLTYGRLEARSRGLAAALVAAGVRRGDVVGVAVARSVDLVVALVAVVRAGAAYLPLDLAYPDARLQYLLDDARPVAVIGDLPSGVDSGGVRALPVDAHADAPLPPPAAGAAYVVHTSGSTGLPKGVVVDHAAVLSLLANTGLDAGPDDVWTMAHSASFDFAVWEMWAPLTTGGRVVVVGTDVARNPDDLVALLHRERVTILDQTPTAFGRIVHHDVPDSLRRIIFGGEALDHDAVQGWRTRHPDVHVVDMYGITETAVHVTRHDVADGQRAIGSALPGLRTYVLDAALAPVPPGTAGELYVAGRQLARGYRGRPGLTTTRFVADPFVAGERMYRTGDRVRATVTDGRVLEYLGRTDAQLEIRGHRVEPAEVEYALRAHPGIDTAAVAARDLGSGPVLVAYVVAADPELESSAVLAHARAVLPNHLVPSAAMLLGALPRTTNGKLDRDALPTEVAAHVIVTGPRTALESAIARAVTEVVRVGAVDVDTDLFELGVDSIAATRLASAITRTTELAVGIRDVFENPTVASLAAVLADRPAHAPVAAPVDRPERPPLTRSQHRMWSAHRLDPESTALHVAGTVAFDGPVDVAALRCAIDDIVGRHEALRTRYPLGPDGTPYQDVAADARLVPGGDGPPGPDFVTRPFVLANSAPVRLHLERADTRWILHVTAHHIAVDEWSLRRLGLDLVHAYGARTAGVAPQWEQVGQPVDHALRERTSSVPEPSAAAPVAAATLHAVGPRTGVAGTIRRTAPVDVRALARTAGVTVFSAAHAAFAIALARLGGSRDVVVASAVADRLHATDTVGMFVDTAALAATVPDAATFARFARDLAAATLDAPVDGADVPPIALGVGTPPEPLALGDVTVAIGDVPTGATKFDLHLHVTHRDGAVDLTAEYDTGRYDADLVTAVVSLVADVLAEAAASPETVVAGLGRGDGAPVPGGDAAPETALADLFAATAAVHADRPALTDGVAELRYRDLAARVHERAEVLRRDGVGPGWIVPIPFGRGIEFVVEMLAIAATGAAYSPGSGIAAAEQRNDAHGLAYVVHTSGTTGTPRPVAVTASGIASLAAAAVEHYRVGPGDRVLHAYRPTFDAALLEILLAIASGACLVVASDDVDSGPELSRFVANIVVTHVLSTPSVLTTLDPDEMTGVRVVGVGGEPLPRALAERWSRGRLLVDAYGTSEATVVSTLAHVHTDPGTIGRPIRGTTAETLDAALRPVPAEGIGELYVSGVGVARGYLGDPATTAVRFVAAPGGAVRYRTGDLVRRRANGTVVYLGRSDRQVQINGVRTELDGLEARIAAVAGVRGCAATVRGGTIVAYVAGDVAAVRRALAHEPGTRSIPVVAVGALPRTANGKIDHGALPDPALDAGEPPATGDERVVADAVRELLGVTVGRDGDFFRAGGTSLTATALTALLETALGVDVPVRLVFENPTPRTLAAALAAHAPAPAPDLARPDRPPLTAAQHRIWIAARIDPSAYTVPVVVRTSADLDGDLLGAAFRDVAARHESLRTRFPVGDDGVPWQDVLPEFTVPVEECSVETCDLEATVDALAAREFDVTAAPPVHVTLLRAESETVVVAVVHHIATDGASVPPLLHDLTTAYAARSAGTAPRFGAAPVQPADVAVREAAATVDDTFWRETFADAATTLAPLPTYGADDDASVTVSIPVRTAEGAAAFAREEGTTLLAVLHTAVAAALGRLSGTTDLTIATVTSGRGPASHDAVGMYVAPILVRTRLGDAATLREAAREVRAAQLAAIAHADVPYGRIVAAAGAPQVSLGHDDVAALPDFGGFAGARVEVRGGDAMLAPVHIHATSGASDALELRVRCRGASRDVTRTLAEHVVAMLTALVADPGADPADVPLRRAEPMRTDAVAPRTFGDVLVRAAAAHPDAVALVADGTAITYRALLAAAREHGRALALAPGSLAGLPAERSGRFVVDVWAAALAGATFTAADPDAVAPLGDLAGVAYVVATSGTTGTPRFVAVPHRGVAAFAATAAHGLAPGDRVLFGLGTAFDAALYPLLAAAGSGATLVVAPQDAFAGPPLADVIAEHAVTHVVATPSILATLDPAAVPSVRHVVCGGEALPASLAAEWSHCVVVDSYGPAESTVVALTGPAGAGLGRPVPGTSARVLDPALRSVVVGGAGELYLDGDGLALGYLGDPATTAARFVAAPGGARRYRTGDRVVARADGSVEFGGRLDRQAKVRGIRVELGALDAVARAVPGVTAAAVTVTGGDLRCYVVGDAATSTVAAALHGAVPALRVPPVVTSLTALPLTANGKLDERALPAASAARPLTTDTQRLVAAAFAAVLERDLDEIGSDTDFFGAGGTSLTATRLVARLGAATERSVPLGLVFGAPVVHDLAAAVDALPRGGAITPEARPERIPLSRAQKRMWIAAQRDPASSLHVLPGLVTIDGPLDVAALRAAFTDLVTRHEVLRARYRLGPDGEPFQEIVAPEHVALDIRSGTVDPDAIHRAASIGFGLLDEVPLRAVLHGVGEQRHVLAVTAHHIAVDGWSIRPLLGDLVAGYAARRAGALQDIPPPAIQVADHALWEARQSIDTSYWRARLAGLRSVAPIPRDREVELRPDTPATAVRVPLAPHVARGVAEFAARAGTTEFVVAHAVLALLCAHESGSADVAIATAVSGRGRPELDTLPGMFVDMVVLRTLVDVGRTAEQHVVAVRGADTSAFAHADTPYDAVAPLLPGHPQIAVALDDFTFDVPPAADLTVTVEEIALPVARSELFFTLDRRAGEVVLTYSTEAFDVATAQRLARRYADLLAEVVGHPGRAVAEWTGSLAVPEAPPADEPAPLVAPRSATELVVADVFAEVARAAQVGALDSFFEIGGDSLAVPRVATRLQEALGAPVPVAAVFANPTVAALASAIDEGLPENGDLTALLGTVVHLGGHGDGAPLFAIHPAGGLAWCYVGLVEVAGGRDVYGVQASALPAAPASITELAAFYVRAVTAVASTGPYHLLGWSLGGLVAHEMAVQLTDAGEQVASLVLLDTVPPEFFALAPDAGGADAEFREAARALAASVALPDDTADRIDAVVSRLRELAPAHVPRPFPGPIDFVTATRALAYHPEPVAAWDGRLGPLVTEHRVDADHHELADPEHLGALVRLPTHDALDST